MQTSNFQQCIEKNRHGKKHNILAKVLVFVICFLGDTTLGNGNRM